MNPEKSLRVNPSLRPYFVLGIGMVAVASASILIRLARLEGASAIVIAAWRLGLATLVLTPVALIKYRGELAKLGRSDILLMGLAGVLLSIHFVSWVSSLDYTSVISSVVLVTTNPIFVAALSPLFLRERFSRGILVGILIAITGTVLVSLTPDAGSAPVKNSPLLGNILALIGSISFAGYILIGRRVRAHVSVIPYIWATYGSAALIAFFFVFTNRLPVAGLAPNAYFWMCLMALLPQLIGHTTYNYALGYLPAAYVSLTVMAEPIGSTILAFLIFAERPAVIQLVGSALIFIALLVGSREQLRGARQAQANQAAIAAAEPSL